MLLSLKPILKARQNTTQPNRSATESPVATGAISKNIEIEDKYLLYTSITPEIDFMTDMKLNNSFSQILSMPNSTNHMNISEDMFPTMDFSTTEGPMENQTDYTSQIFTPVDIVWIALFSIMLSVAIFGNIVVIWIIACHRRMRTVTNYFLLNLSVADLTMATLNGAPNFVYMLRNDWIFGKILCIINNFVANFTVASCVFTMTAISIDRWMAIIKPLEPRMTKTKAWLVIVGIWIGSAILASPALVFTSIIPDRVQTWRSYCIMVWPDGKFPTDSTFELGYNVFLFSTTYLIPICIMSVCYGSMSWELWGQTQIGEVTQRQINSMISKRKVVRMFIVVVTTFAICWLPYHAYFIYMYLDKSIVYIKWIQHLYLAFYFLAMSQSSINPIIVIGMNSRFRGYICDLLFNLCSLKPENAPRIVRYVPATPPLFRRYSQSCSRSRSRSGTAEDNHNNHNHNHNHNHTHGPGGKHCHHLNGGRTHGNGVRKTNRYVPTTQEVISLAHCNALKQHEVHGSRNSMNHNLTGSTRATYC